MTKTKAVFPTDDSLLKMLYLAMLDITKKWTGRRQDWAVIHAQLAVYYAKSILHLGSECHYLSYNVLTAHVPLVFIRYILLSLQKRRNEDERTIGELFVVMVDELADMTFPQAMQLIVNAFLQTVRKYFELCEEQLPAVPSSFG